MKAHDKRKATKVGWARQMRAGFINDPSTGNWVKGSSTNAMTLHNYHGCHPHARRKGK